jgi:hypothetical protein
VKAKLAATVLFAVAAVAALVAFLILKRPFPPDTTPDGAYLRIAYAIGEERPRDAFAYQETEAQWACFTIRDLRKKALDRARTSYPEAERATLAAAYESDALAADGADVFAQIAKRRGWIARLRRDLSGVAHVDVDGERATVVTVRGTRYTFRRRDNGIWGMTLFTADLAAEAERAARDLSVVAAAADDYDRAKHR